MTKIATQMIKCADFVVKKAIVIHQENYNLTRLVEKGFDDLPTTRRDASYAAQIARGFGISDSDITYIEDMPNYSMNQTFDNLKKEFFELAEEGKRTFLLVYATGHGVVDQQQYMVLNATSGNMYDLEGSCRDVCEYTKNMCTVVTLNDTGRDQKEHYKGLSLS